MRILSDWNLILQALNLTKGDPAWTESQQLIERGSAPSEMFQMLAVRPDILKALTGFGDSVYPHGLLERALKERVILQTSLDHSCQYCMASHAGTMKRLDLSDDPISGLKRPESLTKREVVALAYAKAAVQDSNKIPDALFAELKTLFSDPEIVELTFLIGLTTLFNLFNNCLQATYHGEYELLSSPPR